MEFEPQFVAEATLNKGFCFQKLGQHEDALSCFDKVLGLKPRNIFAWNNKGLCLENLGCYKDAFYCFQEAMEIEPQNKEAISGRARVMIALADRNELDSI
jgi:tetratricopeptide (TPR) repeat protein